MDTPAKRYEELDLKLSLTQSTYYVEACKELSFFLRHAYSKCPKILQSLIFEDILAAFRLLPHYYDLVPRLIFNGDVRMQTQNSISAANILLQSAESSLPKQKKVCAVKEFKHAMVSCKRRGKAQQEEDGLPHLPEDVLTIIFSFLDIRSLASAAMVCRLWSVAASENQLWESLYASFFGDLNEHMRVHKCESCGMIAYQKAMHSQMNAVTGVNMMNWRNTFKRVYNGTVI